MAKDNLREEFTKLINNDITDEELDKLVRNVSLIRFHHDDTEMLISIIANSYMMGRVSGLKYALNGTKRGEF